MDTDTRLNEQYYALVDNLQALIDNPDTRLIDYPIYDTFQDILTQFQIDKPTIDILYRTLYKTVYDEESFYDYVSEHLSPWIGNNSDIYFDYPDIFYNDTSLDAFTHHIEFSIQDDLNPNLTKLLYYYVYGIIDDYDRNSYIYNLEDMYMILGGLPGVAYTYDNYDSSNIHLLPYIVIYNILLESLYFNIILPRNFFLEGILSLSELTEFMSIMEEEIILPMVEILSESEFDFRGVPNYTVKKINDLITTKRNSDKNFENAFNNAVRSVKNYMDPILSTFPKGSLEGLSNNDNIYMISDILTGNIDLVQDFSNVQRLEFKEKIPIMVRNALNKK